jgi:nitrite reductase/ring-hydroxylating ferredoxin subunit
MENYQWHKIFDSLEEAQQSVSLHGISSIRVEQHKICLAHNQAGIFAVEDYCPHKLIPLSKGHLNEKGEIVCMWHQYCFNLKTGRETTGKHIRPVKLFPIEVREDGVYVRIPIKIVKKDPFSY